MQYGDPEWKAGPVTVSGPTVIAQYDYNYRWNGWLCPVFDPWSIELILNDIKSDQEYWQDYGVEWEWREDGALVLTERQAREEATEEYPFHPEVVMPDEDGLYDLFSYNWCWYEDERFYDNTAHQEWEADRDTVWRDAYNAKNQEQHATKTYSHEDRQEWIAVNEKAGKAAVDEWEKTHPEPPAGRDETRVPGQRGVA